MIRPILLTASRSRFLARWLPRLPPVRSAMSRFMPGEGMEDALRAARELEESGVGAVLTHLGEDVARMEEVREVSAEYGRVVEAILTDGPGVELSVKPSQFGLHMNPEACLRAVLSLARQVEEAGSFLWIDMERSSDVEGTLRIYRELLSAHPCIGICLQAYLHRTEEDVEGLMAFGMEVGHPPAIRLVKGAYRESPSVALTGGGEIDHRFIILAQRIRAESGKGVRLALGTHDESLIRKLAEDEPFSPPGPQGRAPVEVHMLYGIRTDLQARIRSQGIPLRVLISYGTAWYPWFVRRLAERPANLRFLLRRSARATSNETGSSGL